jgi:hypothetical protein
MRNFVIHTLYQIINIIITRKMGWAGHACKILVGIPETKRPMKKRQSFKMDVGDTGDTA